MPTSFFLGILQIRFSACYLIREMDVWNDSFSPYETKGDFQEVIYSIRSRYETMYSKSRIALTIPIIPFLGLRNPNDKE